MTHLTRWVLAHRRLVVAFWVLVTFIGIATSGAATKAMDQHFSVPGREGWVTNEKIKALYGGTGGDGSPLVPVVSLPQGKTASDPAVRSDLRALETKITQAVPGTRLAGYGSTGNRAFVSKDGRTAFVIAYPPLDPDEIFGNNPKPEKKLRAALKGATVGGAAVHLSGFDALANSTGGDDGAGVLLEALLGAVGAMFVLAFVFASLMAFVPIL